MKARNLAPVFVCPLVASLLLLAACADEGSHADRATDAGADLGADATDALEPSGQVRDWACEIDDGAEAEFLERIGCVSDFEALASAPLDASLPGAISTKVVLDRLDNNHLYFQNSQLYPIHYEFASTHLSGGALPIIGTLSDFNTTEYYDPDRRFVLGAVTYYEALDIWALEMAPYDTADADLIATLYEAVESHAYFGPRLYVHPTSEAVAASAADLPATVPQVSTDQIYAGIDFQPLSLGTGIGRLHFANVADLESEYLAPTDIAVLDQAPNDISVVQGLITAEFQTPLSHVNVLSQNRRTPNMGLRGAMDNETLRSLEGELVELVVSADGWSVRPVSLEEAETWWEEHRPEPVVLPALDLTETRILSLDEIAVERDGVELRDTIKEAVRAWGGKVAHYAILRRTEGVPVRPGFGIPVYYYDQFMRENGFWDDVDALLADTTFRADAAVREASLAALRERMMTAPINTALLDEVLLRHERDFAGVNLRFRTSTNSEDLDGFPCAGCYESHTGTYGDVADISDAIRETWASAWLYRTFEEREYYGVAHDSVGMALLVHENFPDEEANGVAVTNNPFDPSGLNPALYVNVQFGGDVEVVAPDPGTTSDQFLVYNTQPGQPVVYIAHSNLIDEGTTVLDAGQVHALVVALQAIHQRFSEAYGPASGNTGWYAMDIEFKFDDVLTPGDPTLYIKQARPYPGRGE